MSHILRPALLPALLVAALCASAGSPASGQPPPSPGLPAYPPYSPYSPVTQPTQQSGVVARPTAPPASYAPPPLNVNQYAPNYGPYAGVPYTGGSLTGGGLTGAANALNASGEYEKQFQQARLMNQDVERSKIDTHRAKIDEWMWERNNMPTLEDNRQRDQYWQLRQNLDNPPPAQVWDGTALNVILAAIKQVQPPDSPGPTVPLPPGVATQLSLTTGGTSTGVGLLKNGPKLEWPYALQGDDFTAQRTDIDKLIKTAYEQVSAGPVNYNVLRQLKAKLDDMAATLKADIEQMTPTDNVQGNRYVRELRDTVRALQQPDASTYFASCRSFPASTVGDLVQNMVARGQTFAPATTSAEPAYNVVYAGMAGYYRLLTQPTAR